jgi:hypothetical protein
MNADMSNIVIVDKGGRIRFFTSGEVKAEEINGDKELLELLSAKRDIMRVKYRLAPSVLVRLGPVPSDTGAFGVCSITNRASHTRR